MKKHILLVLLLLFSSYCCIIVNAENLTIQHEFYNKDEGIITINDSGLYNITLNDDSDKGYVYFNFSDVYKSEGILNVSVTNDTYNLNYELYFKKSFDGNIKKIKYNINNDTINFKLIKKDELDLGIITDIYNYPLNKEYEVECLDKLKNEGKIKLCNEFVKTEIVTLRLGTVLFWLFVFVLLIVFIIIVWRRNHG